MFSNLNAVALCAGVLLLIMSCKSAQTIPAEDPHVLNRLLKANPGFFQQVLDQKDSMRLQIIYTKIDRDGHNRARFTDYTFNLKEDLYFYPASTIKMPLAFLALERLQQLGIDANATMITEAAGSGQTAVFNDPTSADGRPTAAHYMKKLFVVSDNDASNRLYEFLGQEYLHRQLQLKGYPGAQIRHRLSIPLSDSQNRRTNPLRFFDASGNLLYEQPEAVSTYRFKSRNDAVGNGYMQGEKRINQPMDFSNKNRFFLADLHRMLRTVLFPESVPEQQRFQLSEQNYRLLYQYMSQLPVETAYPQYDSATHPDNYVKFLFWGDQQQKPLPPGIRIFNKVGWAYGFLTDVAYIVDFENKIEFLLSATIYCNSDGILNDDAYDFDRVGIPFLANLGRVVYDYERKRKRKHMPDLSRFWLTYERQGHQVGR